MAELNIDLEKAEDLVGRLVKMASQDVSNVCQPIATALRNADASDQVAQSVLGAMQKFQAQHNVAIDGCVNNIIKELNKVPEFAAMIAKIDANRVQNTDAGFKVRKQLDPSAIC